MSNSLSENNYPFYNSNHQINQPNTIAKKIKKKKKI